VEEKYYQQYLYTLDKECFPVPDVTIKEVICFYVYCADGAQPKGHTEILLGHTRMVLCPFTEIHWNRALHIPRFMLRHHEK